MYLGSEHQAFGIHQQVPLAAADLLATVVAPLLPAHSGRLGGLGVDYSGAGVRGPAKPHPQALAQLGVQTLPRPVDAPSPEPVVSGLIATHTTSPRQPHC